MSYTQVQLDSIKEAYAEGVTKVVYNGKVIEYRTLSEMKSIISDIETSLSGARSDTDKAYFPTYGRGYQ